VDFAVHERLLQRGSFTNAFDGNCCAPTAAISETNPLLRVSDSALSPHVGTAAGVHPHPYALSWVKPSSQRGCSLENPRRGTSYVHRRRGRRSGRGLDLVTSRSHSLDLLAAAQTLAQDRIEQPTWVKQLALAPGSDAYTGIPMWRGAQHWARISVPIAYDLWYKQIRPLMPDNGVSRQAVIKVADARASFADGASGRHCRPSNATLAAMCELSERTVQRASLALRLMGCATEVLRGRQRTKKERLASWAMGDRARGWASVWALHPPRPVVDNSRDEKGLWRPLFLKLSPHPRRGSLSVEKRPFRTNSPTHSYPQPHDPDGEAGQGPPIKGGAPRPASIRAGSTGCRYAAVDEEGRLLALRWLSDGQTPSWAHKHTPRGWAGVLAGPAAHGWTPDDINQMLREWVRVGGHWMPETPYKPIGLLHTVLAWHGDLDNPPAAADRAREAADRAAAAAHLARELADNAAKDATTATAQQRAAARAYFAERRRQRRQP
jgi:hypothetical protein